MGMHEIKILLHNKKLITRLKRLTTEWEKIFASYTSIKELIIRICKEFKKSNSPKIHDP
jgi:transposase